MDQGLLRAGALVAGGAALVAAISGCSMHRTQQLSKEQVEQRVNEQLTKQVGQRPDAVTCPHSLDGKEGASMRCELTAGGQKLGVTTKVTSVQGDNVQFDIAVDPQ